MYNFCQFVTLYYTNTILGVVRQNVIIFRKFIEMGGNDLIVFALKSPIDKLKIKSAFLINSSCHLGNDIVGKFKYNNYYLLKIKI